MQDIQTYKYLFCIIYKNTEYHYCCYSVIVFKNAVASKSPRDSSLAQTGKSFFILQLGSYAPHSQHGTARGVQCSGLPM